MIRIATDTIDKNSVPRGIAPKPYIGYAAMSEGELSLSLLHRRLDILRAYTGDPLGELSISQAMIVDAFNSGLHGSKPIYTGVLTDLQQKVARQITTNHRKNRSASNRISISRDAIGMSLPEFFEDCDEVAGRVFDEILRSGGNFGTAQRGSDEAKIKCEGRNGLINILNNRWEEGAPHAAYEFITFSQSSKFITNGQGPFKEGSHKSYYTAISSITGISRSNLRSWGENGIMSQSVINPEVNQPLSSVDFIDTLRLGASSTTDSIGIDPLVAGLIITGVIGILRKALLETSRLKAEMKINEGFLNQAIAVMGSNEISADTIEWYSDKAADGFSTPEEVQAGSNQVLGLGLGIALFGAGIYLNR